MSNIIIAEFDNSNYILTSPVYQYDYGLVLKINGIDLPDVYEVHFSNLEFSGESETSIGNSKGVEIPNTYLTSGEYIYAWLFLHTGENDGEVEFKIEIPVRKRAKPNDEYTPEQETVIERAIALLNSLSNSVSESEYKTSLMAILAESWAKGGTDTRAGEDTNNAKFYAELAQQSANAAGYVFFDVNDETGMLEVTSTTHLLDDVTFSIDENTGLLEVIVNE